MQYTRLIGAMQLAAVQGELSSSACSKAQSQVKFSFVKGSRSQDYSKHTRKSCECIDLRI